MELEELKCPACKEFFNESKKIPRLLYNCGHTICQECISEFICQRKSIEGVQKNTFNSLVNDDSNFYFTCPEDNIKYEGPLKVEMFPKNLTLIKLINKSKPSYEISNEKYNKNLESNNVNLEASNITGNIEKGINGNSQILNYDTSFKEIKENENNLNIWECDTVENIQNSKSNRSENSNNNIMSNLRSSIRKGSTINNNYNHPVDSSSKFCSNHPSRILEVICIDDKVKICTNCALFGEHRNHKIINEEDFLKEIEIKAEILIELFDLIDTNINSYKTTESIQTTVYESLIIKSENKLSNLINEIKSFSDDLILKIKEAQNKIEESLQNKFEKVNKKILAYKDIPNEILAKSNEWKNSVQSKLDLLNEITESNNLNDDFVKLIETNLTDQDLITSAEEIINQFEKIKSFPKEKIENIIENNKIEFNSELSDRIKQWIKFSDEENLEEEILNLDEEDNKRLEKIGDSSNNHNENIATNSNSIFTTCFSNDVDVSIVNNTNINFQNNENGSFLNLSEDSTFIKISSSIVPNVTETCNKININSNHKILTSSTSNKNLNTEQKIKSKNQYSTNTNTNLNINTNMNVIKLPFNPHTLCKDKSRSPVKKSPQNPDKDKMVFIKTQFKNECANFTGYEIGEDSAKVISNLISNTNMTAYSSNPTTSSSLQLSKLKELKLTKTNLTDETANTIIKALESNHHITTLNLSKNHLSDKSIDNLVNLLNKNKMLKSINLTNNNFSTTGKDKIKSYAGGSKMVKIFL